MNLLKGILALVFIILNTIAVWIPLTWWLIKLLFVSEAGKGALKKRMDKIIWWWTGNNRRMIATLNLTTPQIEWDQSHPVSPEKWYLVISNHQTWTDILLLQTYLYGDLPPLKFFTKQQLIWLPGIGLAMKVLGFPYVKRATPSQIKANPKLRNADRENTKAACEDFKNHPTCVLNFVEGTRRTPEKHASQNNEYNYLLRPKIGGLDYVLEGMDDYLDKLIDVTIIYPNGVPSMWEFLQGKVPNIQMNVTPREIPSELKTNPEKRRTILAAWIKEMWLEKDAQLTRVMQNQSTVK